MNMDKPQRTKKVAKKKPLKKQKTDTTESENDTSSSGSFLDTMSKVTEDYASMEEKDDLNYDTAVVLKRNKRDVLKRKNTQGFGDMNTVGWQLTMKEMFTREDNTKLRYTVVKHVTQSVLIGHVQMVPLTAEGVGLDYRQQIAYLIKQLPKYLPIEKPKMIHATYNYMNPEGAKQQGQEIPIEPYRTGSAYTLLILFRSMDVVIDSSHLTRSDQEEALLLEISGKCGLLLESGVKYWWPENVTKNTLRWVDVKITAREKEITV